MSILRVVDVAAIRDYYLRADTTEQRIPEQNHLNRMATSQLLGAVDGKYIYEGKRAP